MNIVEQLFGDDRLSRYGGLIALKWESGSWTFDELANRINSTAQSLFEVGVDVGDRVVFLCSDTPVFVAAYFAVMKLGAVSIAVSTRSSADDLVHVCRDSNAKVVVYDGGLAGGLSQLGKQVKAIEISSLATKATRRIREVQFESCPRSSTDESLWVYSSGSTSSPKGIVHTHKEIGKCDWFHTDHLKVQAGDIIFCTSKISFAYALANGLIAPLSLGAGIYLHPGWVTPVTVKCIISVQNFKAIFSVPTIYRYLLNDMENGKFSDFNRPEFFVSAGEHLSEKIQCRWTDVTGVPLINVYGCSETLFLAFVGDGHTTPNGSVGKPMPLAQVKLIKGNLELPNDAKESGALHLQHPYMFSHYANRVQETAQQLNNGWFATGDLYSSDEQGNWYHQGPRGRVDKGVRSVGEPAGD